jgi:hypothetical protein
MKNIIDTIKRFTQSEPIKFVGHVILVSIFIYSIAAIFYFFNLVKMGPSGQNAETTIFGVKVIYPVANTPACETLIMTADLRVIEAQDFLSGARYYLIFENGDKLQIYDDVAILAWHREKKYNVTYCEGVIMEWK